MVVLSRENPTRKTKEKRKKWEPRPTGLADEAVIDGFHSCLLVDIKGHDEWDCYPEGQVRCRSNTKYYAWAPARCIHQPDRPSRWIIYNEPQSNQTQKADAVGQAAYVAPGEAKGAAQAAAETTTEVKRPQEKPEDGLQCNKRRRPDETDNSDPKHESWTDGPGPRVPSAEGDGPAVEVGPIPDLRIALFVL